ncbi:MAG: hypothetical protein KF716_07805 [Anaerolineae bacterium]|nr:hypothetical protein [Anaerolineae bacterium]
MAIVTNAKTILEKSKSLIQEGEFGAAKVLLLQLLNHDPSNGRAWYAYSFVAETLDKQIDAVEKTLILRPDSQRAAYRLQKLKAQVEAITPNQEPADEAPAVAAPLAAEASDVEPVAEAEAVTVVAASHELLQDDLQ